MLAYSYERSSRSLDNEVNFNVFSNNIFTFEPEATIIVLGEAGTAGQASGA